jgi:hypothetical protein
MSQVDLSPELVEFIPEKLNEGILYISRRYRTASHLCCCGCGREVVTPLNAAKWQLIEHPDGKVSLSPSVGTLSFPCKSHYFVIRNRIQWAGALSPQQIAAVQAIDRHDVVMLGKDSRSRWVRLYEDVRHCWASLTAAIARMLRR